MWSTPLPQTVAWSQPLVTKNRFYQFTSRGVCEVDKASGRLVNLFRGDDLDSLGGAMFVVPGTLVTVSNVGLTAYALGEARAEPPSAGTDRPVSPNAPADGAPEDGA